MAVLQLVARFPLPAGPRPEAAWRLEACGDRPPRAAIVALAQTSGADRDHEPPWPTPTGLAAELQSRPGRIVETWLAWAQEPPTESPAGLATLVTATGRQRIRHSIGWLLVHPSARRCGLGRQLVTELLAVAAERGVTDVWVETRSEWPAATAFWRACGFSEPA